MTNYNILAIAGRISYLRRQNNLTLDEAAQKLGIQRRSLSNIESGAKGCSIDLLVRIADTYGCSLDYLILGRDIDGNVAKLLDFEHQENLVCYAEESQGSTRLCATLYDLDGPMKKLLWNRPQGVILTSGTMAVGTDFQRFRTDTGLTDSYRVTESVWESPFDYLDHALLYLPEYPPLQFGGRQDLYYDALAGEIARLIRAASGHTLVLFTSYSAMSAVKERLLEQGTFYPLLAMGHNPSRTMQQFQAMPGAVLLATGSAWEGMDFPGDMVSLLVIPKLPFPYPNELKEKQKQQYSSLQDFINSVVLPEMQIKLRQGFGRAIRTETDTCVIAMLDDRAATGQRYHAAILQALPKMAVTDDLEDVERFIWKHKPDRYFKEGRGYLSYGTSREDAAGDTEPNS